MLLFLHAVLKSKEVTTKYLIFVLMMHKLLTDSGIWMGLLCMICTPVVLLLYATSLLCTEWNTVIGWSVCTVKFCFLSSEAAASLIQMPDCLVVHITNKTICITLFQHCTRISERFMYCSTLHSLASFIYSSKTQYYCTVHLYSSKNHNFGTVYIQH
jgi:hypothetical protein